jgi:hypothetical protein
MKTCIRFCSHLANIFFGNKDISNICADKWSTRFIFNELFSYISLRYNWTCMFSLLTHSQSRKGLQTALKSYLHCAFHGVLYYNTTLKHIWYEAVNIYFSFSVCDESEHWCFNTHCLLIQYTVLTSRQSEYHHPAENSFKWIKCLCSTVEEYIYCSLNYIIFIIPSAGCGCYMYNTYFYWIIPSVTRVVAMFRITKVWESNGVKVEIYFWMFVRQGCDLCENWDFHSGYCMLLSPGMRCHDDVSYSCNF